VTEDQAARIRSLCDQWCATCERLADGGVRVGGPDAAKLRLRRNGVDFTQLSYREMREACIGLTRVLLVPSLSTIVSEDHREFWAWCAQVMLGPNYKAPYSAVFGPGSDGLERLAIYSLRVALVTPDPIGSAFPDNLEDIHRQAVLLEAGRYLTYFAFPLLEGVLRKQCSSFVDSQGKVLKRFHPPRRRQPYSLGSTCSNIADLLHLLESEVANEALKDALQRIESHISSISGKEDGYRAIFTWRNATLHGEDNISTVGGTALQISLLIMLDRISGEYDELRLSALDTVSGRSRSHARIFYAR
jgi:hypothetical protein